MSHKKLQPHLRCEAGSDGVGLLHQGEIACIAAHQQLKAYVECPDGLKCCYKAAPMLTNCIACYTHYNRLNRADTEALMVCGCRTVVALLTSQPSSKLWTGVECPCEHGFHYKAAFMFSDCSTCHTNNYNLI